MNFIFFLIFLFLTKPASLSKIVKFKFEKYPTNLVNVNSLKMRTADFRYISSNDYFFRLFTDDFYLNLTVGSPKQTISTIWNMNQYSFKFYNLSFNKEESSTFKNTSSLYRYNFDESSDAIKCIDEFYFIDENDNSFSNYLDFVKFEQGNKSHAFIGLQLPNTIADGLITFISSMKQNKIVDKYLFFIYYNENQNNDDIDNFKGNIFFGEYPHNINSFNDKFKENNFHETLAGYRSNSLVYWDIKFDNIYFGSIPPEKNIRHDQAELAGNMRISVGTDEYQDYISKNFFDEYVNKNICEFKTILNDTDYMYYECKNNKEFDITKFPTLKFELNELDYKFNFSLNYKDLFFTHDNHIIFGIFFDRFFKLKFEQRWKLGSALFRKYLFVFNQDTKKIGFYKNALRNNDGGENDYIDDSDETENEINKSDNGNNVFIKIIIIIGLLIFLVLIVFIIVKYFYNNNKRICSRNINYHKKNVAHDSKNKNEVHEYYELDNGLIN